MKKLMAVMAGVLVAAFVFQGEVKACDDNAFVKSAQAFIAKEQAKVDAFLDEVKAKINRKDVQAKLEQIRAEHRARLKAVLLEVFPKIVEFRKTVSPIVKVQVQLALLELQAAYLDGRMAIFKAKLSAMYEAELDAALSLLPVEVAVVIKLIRASPLYQAERAKLLKAIEAALLDALEDAEKKFLTKLDDFVQSKLDELDVVILAKINSL